MKWSNVRLILAREIRDQLRDRRTLFMIVVLPLLLYPLMGMLFFQFSQFMKAQQTKVLVIGANPSLEETPSLIDHGRFAVRLFGSPDQASRLDLIDARDTMRPGETLPQMAQRARDEIKSGKADYDAAVYFPPEFAEQLERFREASKPQVPATDQPAEQAGETRPAKAIPQPPRIELFCNKANERSQLTCDRLDGVLSHWMKEVGQANITAAGFSPNAAEPLRLETANLSTEEGAAESTVWAKLLPVMLLLWALTGAFYPAVDLCAGEKERGTLETLLSSPAGRNEIVVGKLVTIMLFSMLTAILNLVVMGLIGWFLLAKMSPIGVPSLISVVWLLVALVPISALFSALCLALAALARSTKEGQYYLMPLMMICMPLAILPIMPGIELNLGNSLIPVMNVVLLLRTLLEGDYALALRYAMPVLGVTFACCILAIRWAVDQFNQESVLFRESEQLDIILWIRHLIRDRKPTPSVPMALMCGLLILVLEFFLSLAMPFPENFRDVTKIIIATQLVVILAPALLMAFFLTSNPARTLLLDFGGRQRVPLVALATLAAVALAFAIHPLAVMIDAAMVNLYPVPESAKALAEQLGKAPSFLTLLLLIAVVPPLCEEVAFRGFILSGLRHTGKKWRAIIITAVLFGMTHAFLQQKLSAVLVGMVIGYLAVQTGNLLPCIAYHMVHNTLVLAISKLTPELLVRHPRLEWFINSGGGHSIYTWLVVVLGGVLAMVLLLWFSRLPYQKTEEEQLRDAIKRGAKADEERLASTLT